MLKKILLGVLVLLITMLGILYRSDIPASEIRARYTDSASQFISIMGMEVHYKDEGLRTDSLPLVLIHGLSSSLHTWDSLVLRLKGEKRIIRMDLPAFGVTGPNPERNYGGDYYNRFIDSLLTRLDIDSCILAGNSMGGFIAWSQAVKDTQKIRGLVLIDAAGYPRKGERGNLGFRLASMKGVSGLLAKFTPKALIRKSLEDTYENDSIISDALVDRYYDLLLREGNRDALIDLFSQPRNANPERIKEIKVPTIIIWGVGDHLIDVQNAYHFQQDIPGSTTLILQKSGHVPMEETPEPIAAAMRVFFSRF